MSRVARGTPSGDAHLDLQSAGRQAKRTINPTPRSGFVVTRSWPTAGASRTSERRRAGSPEITTEGLAVSRAASDGGMF